jgi:hypothetical protein
MNNLNEETNSCGELDGVKRAFGLIAWNAEGLKVLAAIRATELQRHDVVDVVRLLELHPAVGAASLLPLHDICHVRRRVFSGRIPLSRSASMPIGSRRVRIGRNPRSNEIAREFWIGGPPRRFVGGDLSLVRRTVGLSVIEKLLAIGELPGVMGSFGALAIVSIPPKRLFSLGLSVGRISKSILGSPRKNVVNRGIGHMQPSKAGGYNRSMV